MDSAKREVYLYLEDLKLLGITNEVTYASHLEEVFGLSFGEAFNIAMDFLEKYDELYKEYNLDDLFPKGKWFEIQERVLQNKDSINWILSEIEHVKLTNVMRKFKVSRAKAIEMMKDAVLCYGVGVSRMKVDVRNIPDNPCGETPIARE